MSHTSSDHSHPRRRLEGYASRSRFAVASLIFPAVVSFVAMILLASGGGIFFYVAIACFVSCLAGAKGIEMYKYRTFDCPECDNRLPKPKIIPGENVTFTCQQCAIEWDTGIRMAQGD